MQSEPTPRSAWLRAAAVLSPAILLVAIAYFWRFGYSYGGVDHDEFIPAVLALLDPALFRSDWFVQFLAESFTVRTPFLVLLAAIAAVFPPAAAVMLVYAACVVAITAGLLYLARELGATPSTSFAGVAAALVVTPTWTLGGNMILYQQLVPELVGWALVVPGIVLVLRQRFLTAALLLGLATWFHTLAGFLAALSLGVTLLTLMRQGEGLASLRRVVTHFATPYSVFVLLLVAFVGMAPLQADAVDVTGLSSFYIVAELRLPHHYLPFSFGAGRYFRFGVLAVLGTASILWLRRERALPHSAFLLHWLSAIAALGVIGFLFTEVVPILLVAKLQLFKLTVLAQVVLTITAVMAAFRLLPTFLRARFDGIASSNAVMWPVALGAVVITIGLVVFGVGRPAAMYQPSVHQKTDLHAVERWAREETPIDALFAVPPSNTTFRTYARRSVAVTFKSMPFEDVAMHRWFERLLLVAPADLPERGLQFVDRLDEAYHANELTNWERIGRELEVDYVLVDDRQLINYPPGEIVFHSGSWMVYALDSFQPDV